MGEPLGAGAARIGGRLEVGQDVVVEEVGERSVATSWRRPAMRRVSATRPSDGNGAPSPDGGEGGSAGSGRASAPTGPASCMTPRPWVKRECSAVGKTQRALCNWLMRRSRCSQAVSRRSSSATSSAGSPAAADSAGAEPLGEFDVPVDRVADEVDCGEWVPPDRSGQGTQMRDWRPSTGPHCHGGRSLARGWRSTGHAAGRARSGDLPVVSSRSVRQDPSRCGTGRRSRGGRRCGSGGAGRTRSRSSSRRRPTGRSA